MKNISILGSTGSIGLNTMKIIDNLKNQFNVQYLSAYSNIDLLVSQAIKYKPRAIIIGDKKLYSKAKELLSFHREITILLGEEGLLEASSSSDIDVVVNAIVGASGLKPTIAAAKAGKYIALANKESLVMAGEIVNELCRKCRAVLHPIDSEHSAIFQALLGEDYSNINKIYLTASGGPFRTRKANTFNDITLEEALNHPNWSMGKKITIDSATMMNKGLELIEAVHLFNVEADKIQIVVHPESVIHSMVEYVDNSIIAQLGIPDMRVPIQFALTYPSRKKLELPKLDFFKLQNITFYKPDYVLFPALQLATDSISAGGTMPVVLNAVNEIMVHKFLEGKIKFIEITRNIRKELEKHKNISNPTIDDVFAVNDEMFAKYK